MKVCLPGHSNSKRHNVSEEVVLKAMGVGCGGWGLESNPKKHGEKGTLCLPLHCNHQIDSPFRWAAMPTGSFAVS